ncbi:putative papain-like cysteine peptidase superfamily [Helianthus annuus]|nr:putative papain-like cysteine peptidase superfamily [Helianthus annuus]
MEEALTLPLLPEVQFNLFKHYQWFISACFHPYLSHIQDVRGDGNCGFRSIAVGLSLHETDWPLIRRELLGECNRYQDLWNTIDSVEFQLVRNSLDWNGIEFAPETKWLLMPFTGIVIANRWSVICHLLNDVGCTTFFPC